MKGLLRGHYRYILMPPYRLRRGSPKFAPRLFCPLSNYNAGPRCYFSSRLLKNNSPLIHLPPGQESVRSLSLTERQVSGSRPCLRAHSTVTRKTKVFSHTGFQAVDAGGTTQVSVASADAKRLVTRLHHRCCCRRRECMRPIFRRKSGSVCLPSYR